MTFPSLRLSLDLHPVGPRGPLATAAKGWFALNVAAAYDLPTATPTNPGDENMVEALMPASLFPESVTKTFRLFIYASGYERQIDVDATVVAPSSFSTKVAAQLLDDVKTMAMNRQLRLGWGGIVMHEGDEEDAPGKPRPQPWFGIATALTGLPPSIAGPLRSRWYVELDLQPIRDALSMYPDARLLLAPLVIKDRNRNVDFELYSRSSGGGDAVTISYQSTGEPDVLAHAVPLSATALQPDTDAELKTYWLAIEDSRADSVAEIDQILENQGDPITIAALPSLEMIASAVSSGAPTPVPVTGDLVAALKESATRVANSLSPQARQASARTFAEKVLGRQFSSIATVAAATSEELAAWWSANWPAISAKLLNGELSYSPDVFKNGLFSLVPVDLAAGFRPLVDGLFRVNARAAAVLPNEGIDFVVRNKDARVSSLDVTQSQKRTTENEIAAIGLLVRRDSTGSFATAPWRMVTAGQPVLDPGRILRRSPWGSADTSGLDVDDEIAVTGIPLAYLKGVLRNDDTYRGQLMSGPSALSFIHDIRGEGVENPSDWHDPAEIAFASPAIRRPAGYEAALAPPLRYGDHYQFGAFVRDRAGGVPREIALATVPWRADFSNLSVPNHYSCPITFKRRVPLGGANVLTPNAEDWPKPAKGVTLLATEWYSASRGERALPPALLFSEIVNGAPKFPGTLTILSFNVEPPRIGEHTLQCWALPRTDAPAAQARLAIDELLVELRRIAELRKQVVADQKQTKVDDQLPHDPAVAMLLLRTQVYDSNGAPVGVRKEGFNRFQPKAGQPFLKQPVRVAIGPGLTGDNQIAVPPPGHFAVVDILLLVAEPDQARFDSDVLGYGALETVLHGGATYYAYPSETLLLETATDELPDPDKLYDALSLMPDETGRIVASFSAGVAKLSYVDRFELRRQRWVWRNLPFVTKGSGDVDRRLSSGLPGALQAGLQSVRDSDDEVLRFDAMTELDHGFVGRPQFAARWPRDPKGLPAGPVQLLADDRDGQSSADYLRYALNVTSRYAAVLPLAQRSVTARPNLPASPWNAVRGDWCRVATRDRSLQPLRSLNILALLPLTAKPQKYPDPAVVDVPEGATPFLVILDEIWFREYGPGEMLRAELALEDREIGESPIDERPLRLGPLPHKHVAPSGIGDKFTDENAEKEPSLRLRVFGPFGFSLDRSGNEALANATAFLVYWPESYPIGPNWSAAIRFRRVLQGLESNGNIDERVGPPSSSYLVYSLADSRDLVRPRTGRPRLTVLVDGAGRPSGQIRFEDADVQLHPYRRGGSPPIPSIQNQYRYLLLVGRLVGDGGHGVDAFLPQNALWLTGPASAAAIGAATMAVGDTLQGQLLEIELNGSFAAGASPLEQSLGSMGDLFKRMLQAVDETLGKDAPGRITRVSIPFAVDPVTA